MKAIWFTFLVLFNLTVFSQVDMQIKVGKKATISNGERILVFNDGSWVKRSQNTAGFGLSFDEIAELHSQNLVDLQAKRGLSRYRFNRFTSQELDNVLDEYYENVGVLIYTLEYDTMHINLITKTHVYSARYPLFADTLIRLVSSATMHFAEGGKSWAARWYEW
jgi:hypothetical protein